MVTRRGLLQIAEAAGFAAATDAVGVPAAPARAAIDVSAHGATPDRTLNTNRLQAALDDIVKAAAIGVLAEVHDGARVWRGTSGVSRLDTHQPVPVADGSGRAASPSPSSPLSYYNSSGRGRSSSTTPCSGGCQTSCPTVRASPCTTFCSTPVAPPTPRTPRSSAPSTPPKRRSYGCATPRGRPGN
jgi:hypothetical protein